VDDSFGQPDILFHDPGIVGGGDQEHVPDLFGHEFVEDFETRIKIISQCADVQMPLYPDLQQQGIRGFKVARFQGVEGQVIAVS
jgi:hypothetical protein